MRKGTLCTASPWVLSSAFASTSHKAPGAKSSRRELFYNALSVNPTFRLKTATVGDPVLCHIGSLSAFEHSIFLRDAELGGHLQGYKNPGRLMGKGWLDVQFDRLVLSGEDVVPISAKVISAPNARVDREGKIHGRGHAKRGAIEWMIPVLWPIYPAFKGETRLTLRVLEDVQVRPSVAATVSASALPSRGTAGSQAYPVITLAPDSRITLASISSAYRPAGSPQPTLDQGRNQRSTLIVLKGGAAYVARQYWVEDGQMRCHWRKWGGKRVRAGEY